MRAGGLPALIRKRVYLPIRPAFRTNSSSLTPARSLRSKRWKRTSGAPLERATALTGQPLPWQRTTTFAP